MREGRPFRAPRGSASRVSDRGRPGPRRPRLARRPGAPGLSPHAVVRDEPGGRAALPGRQGTARRTQLRNRDRLAHPGRTPCHSAARLEEGKASGVVWRLPEPPPPLGCRRGTGARAATPPWSTSMAMARSHEDPPPDGTSPLPPSFRGAAGRETADRSGKESVSSGDFHRKTGPVWLPWCRRSRVIPPCAAEGPAPPGAAPCLT